MDNKDLCDAAIRFARVARAITEWQILYSGSVPIPDELREEFAAALQNLREAEAAEKGSGE